MRESSIESYLVRKVKEHGGLCYKFVSPGNPGVPDRIIITPTGKTVYVELKTEIGKAGQGPEMAERRAGETGGGCPGALWDGTP